MLAAKARSSGGGPGGPVKFTRAQRRRQRAHTKAATRAATASVGASANPFHLLEDLAGDQVRLSPAQAPFVEGNTVYSVQPPGPADRSGMSARPHHSCATVRANSCMLNTHVDSKYTLAKAPWSPMPVPARHAGRALDHTTGDGQRSLFRAARQYRIASSLGSRDPPFHTWPSSGPAQPEQSPRVSCSAAATQQLRSQTHPHSVRPGSGDRAIL